MPKPNLRTLLLHVRERAKGLSPSHYALLEALVDELEAQQPPQVEGRIVALTQAYDGAKERLEASRAMRQAWEKRCLKADQELAKANRRYDESRTAWARLEASLREQISEAKAEIAELKDVPNRQRDTIHHLNERFSTLYAEFVESKEELASYTASVNADADLGKMVRRMRDGTRLGKAGGTYWSCQHDSAGDIFSCYEPSTDPIMALRPIQRKGVGDAKMR